MSHPTLLDGIHVRWLEPGEDAPVLASIKRRINEDPTLTAESKRALCELADGIDAITEEVLNGTQARNRGNA